MSIKDSSLSLAPSKGTGVFVCVGRGGGRVKGRGVGKDDVEGEVGESEGVGDCGW